jgi:hypothetical protein
MRLRRETAEHPFGTLKMRMGATHFLMSPKVARKRATRRADEGLPSGCSGRAGRPREAACGSDPEGLAAGGAQRKE